MSDLAVRHPSLAEPATEPGAVASVASVAADAPPVVDVVVPVLNEARTLETNVRRLHRHLRAQMPFSWQITIADNGSDDGTGDIAEALAEKLPHVRVIRLTRRGRGLALRTAWQTSTADVVAYTDVDLSTGLDALLPLVAPLVSGHSDIAIGSRLCTGARVARGPKRELISRAYNLILRGAFAATFHDAQCGFKALRGDVARVLLPEVADDKWFFDTELLLLADHNGLRIHEVPVDWVDDLDSRVDIVRTARDDLRGLLRVGRRLLTGQGRIDYAPERDAHVQDDMGRQLVVFGIIGAASTAVSAALFLATRRSLGPIRANLLALSATAAANTWANRRYTFARRGPAGRLADYGRGAGVYVGGVALSTAALAASGAAGTAGVFTELGTVAVTWSLTTITRFALLRDATLPTATDDRPPALGDPRHCGHCGEGTSR